MVVVMKRFVLVVCCLLLNVCQAMDNKQEHRFTSINKQELPALVGKAVWYKAAHSAYKKGVLGDSVMDGQYYKVCNYEDQRAGIVCPAEELYLLLEDADK